MTESFTTFQELPKHWTVFRWYHYPLMPILWTCPLKFVQGGKNLWFYREWRGTGYLTGKGTIKSLTKLKNE